MPKTPVAEIDPLGEVVQAAIRMLEATSQFKRGDTGYPDYDGYCARACSAYKYLVDNDERARKLSADPAVSIQYRKDGETSHYWLRNSTGEVLDLNYARGDRPPKRYPYHKGRGANLRRDKKDPRLPARKDTQRIIEVVRASLDGLIE